jgi:tRNA A-37 threonylcarbamoyl transferase component Bud32
MKIYWNNVCDDALLGSINAATADAKLDLLRLPQGGKLTRGPFQYKLLQADKNAVVELKLRHHEFRLIAKFATPSNRFQGITAREGEQLRAVGATLRDLEAGRPLSILAYDESSATLYMEKLAGTSLHSTLKRSLVERIVPGRCRAISKKVRVLGSQLAQLHTHCPHGDVSPMKYALATKLAPLRTLVSRDNVLASGMRCFDEYHQPTEQLTWTHGNLRTDNVILTREGASLIDLENAGSGDPMEDLGRLIAFIVVLRRYPVFPKSFWRSAVASLLEGYASKSEPHGRRLVTAILGEILFLYGRDHVQSARSWPKRLNGHQLAAAVTHMVAICDRDARQVLQNPDCLVR